MVLFGDILRIEISLLYSYVVFFPLVLYFGAQSERL